MTQEATAEADAETPRIPLSRARILHAAVELADAEGIGAVTMRGVGQQLGVEAMSLYNHVANKDALLDGMVELVIGEVPLAKPVAGPGPGWVDALRAQILDARKAMLRHPWAPQVIETRTDISPGLLAHFDAIIGLMTSGGCSLDLAHHAMHALGSRLLGFTQELFVADVGTDAAPEDQDAMFRQIAAAFPNMTALLEVVMHDTPDTTLGGCDDQFEFEFGLDILLEGLERRRLAEGGEASG